MRVRAVFLIFWFWTGILFLDAIQIPPTPRGDRFFVKVLVANENPRIDELQKIYEVANTFRDTSKQRSAVYRYLGSGMILWLSRFITVEPPKVHAFMLSFNR